jgi:competence protein ComEC
MEKGAAWILLIAHWVAGWEGSVTPIPAPGPWVLPLVTFAGAWAILAHGAARFMALAPAAMALVLWAGAERPLVLISEDGALVGVMGPEGRAVSAPKGAGFSARNWLENDGDLAPQTVAATRAGFTGEAGQRRFAIAGLTGIALKGRGSEGRLADACASADIVVAPVMAGATPEGCLLFDQKLLRQTGAVALLADPQGLRLWTTRQENRVWSAPMPDIALPSVIRPNPDRLAALETDQ